MQGTTLRVSQNANGVRGNSSSFDSWLSPGGDVVLFNSHADNLDSIDTNTSIDGYLYSMASGTVQRLSTSELAQGNDHTTASQATSDLRYIAFASMATNLIPGDTNGNQDAFLLDNGVAYRNNSIILTGEYKASVGDIVELSWYGAPALAPFQLSMSSNLNGYTMGLHEFELGAPLSTLLLGTTDADGHGSYLSAPLHSSLAGSTLYFELGVRDANGRLHDSIAHELAIQ